MARLAYTYGHSLDDASDGGNGGSVRNAYNISGNRATSDFDEKHLVELSLVYDLPHLPSSPAFCTTSSAAGRSPISPASRPAIAIYRHQ